MPELDVLQVHSESTVTVTLPFPKPGQEIKIQKTGPGDVVIKQHPLLLSKNTFLEALADLLEAYDAVIEADRDEGVSIRLRGIEEVIADFRITSADIRNKLVKTL